MRSTYFQGYHFVGKYSYTKILCKEILSLIILFICRLSNEVRPLKAKLLESILQEDYLHQVTIIDKIIVNGNKIFLSLSRYLQQISIVYLHYFQFKYSNCCCMCQYTCQDLHFFIYISLTNKYHIFTLLLVCV